ncbi:MAG TPA: Clp protease N-terminal domain-containing protein [Candidatus Limnocylindrales bacterium]|nr:Clp protease N-terminal domain-containing protein [Candidatus Limnocylindrales bacterium]
MPDISIGLYFTWQIAAAEALYGHHALIAPAHLFMGLCSLDKMFTQLQLPDPIAAELHREWTILAELFARFNIDPIPFRRELRTRIGKGSFSVQDRRTISRSPASKAVFARANELAANASAILTQHMLAALLEGTNNPAVGLLKEKGVDVTALGTAALAIPPQPVVIHIPRLETLVLGNIEELLKTLKPQSGP